VVAALLVVAVVVEDCVPEKSFLLLRCVQLPNLLLVVSPTLAVLVNTSPAIPVP